MEFFEFQEVSAINWAHHFGAMYISLEHRYYGDSSPVPDYATDNLKYLSSRQVRWHTRCRFVSGVGGS